MSYTQILSHIYPVIGIIVICITTVYIIKLFLAHRDKEMSRRDKWMQSPLETFSNDEAERLAEKYESDSSSEDVAQVPHDGRGQRTSRKKPRSGSGININITVNGNGNVIGPRGRRPGPAVDDEPKSRLAAFFFCLFLGFLGAHYFYSGRFGMGVLFLLTMGFFGIGWAVDLVRIAVGKFPDRFGYYI